MHIRQHIGGNGFVFPQPLQLLVPDAEFRHHEQEQRRHIFGEDFLGFAVKLASSRQKTDNMGDIGLKRSAGIAWVQQVAQAIAKQIEAEDRERNGKAGHDGKPGCST